MMELLAPAGSPEAVIAAVQSGADMIYMGAGLTVPGRNEDAFNAETLAQSIRYCRIRGCRTAVSVAGLCTDDTLPKAVERACTAARSGADALVIQDVGLIDLLRQVLPDMPLWGDMRLGIHSLAGAATAAAMGLKRVFLAPELSQEQIEAIAKAAPIETAVFVHGPVCFAHSGQCYMSALGDDRRSDNCHNCAEPCRGHFSLGGRMDECPMSMADVCLMDHLQALTEAGVTCAAIAGRGRRPEYVAYVTALYSRAIREGVPPTQEEYNALRDVFSGGCLTDGYFTGQMGPEMFGVPEKPDREGTRMMADIRKGYMNGELRRVPVEFYVVMKQGHPALFAAEDARGNRAVYKGYAPIDLGRQGLSPGRVQEILYRTGGTPFNCTQVHCAIDPDLDYPEESMEDARKALLGVLTDKSREPVSVRVEDMPPKPQAELWAESIKLIVQVTREEQLTEALAETGPDLLYVPAELLAAGTTAVEPFRQQGAAVVAVLPRVVTEAEMPVLRELLEAVKAVGVRQVLIGDLALLPAVRQAGMEARGDFGLNIANSWALERMGQVGLKSVTASFEMTAAQIGALAKTAPTEMIGYGRVPVMVADHCLIRNSSGRCSCATPTAMSDPYGSVYPVEKEFGCRNVIFDGHKIFLADRPELFADAGLWGLRLLFTTESARECAMVAQRYRDRNEYLPNNAGRGAYMKGALV